MMEIPLSFLKEIANQFIFISVFLGGISASILGTLIVSKNDSRIVKFLMLGTSLSALSFIVAVFAFTKVMILSTPGYPLEVDMNTTIQDRAIGGIAYGVGIFSLIFVIGLSGWMSSKGLGIMTSIMGIISFILILMTMIESG